ncbi:MAG: hypothetical protein WC693_02330 [Patescibacteria group bacterium]|jgi:hypothetical protein
METAFPSDFPELGDRVAVILPNGMRVKALVHERFCMMPDCTMHTVLLWNTNLHPYAERLIHRDQKWFATLLSDSSEHEIQLWML